MKDFIVDNLSVIFAVLGVIFGVSGMFIAIINAF